MKKKRTIPFFVVHQGCPFKCVFCDQKSITGYRGDTPFEVEKRINDYLGTMDPEKHKVQAGFFGGSFTGLSEDEQAAFLSPVRKFIERGVISGIRVSTRPDQINFKKLSLLKKNGVTTIELGVQSASDIVLERSRRGYSHETTIKSSRLIRSMGFSLVHQVMIGLPGSDFDKEFFTATEVVRLRSDEARIYPLIVVKGTALAEMWKDGYFKTLPEPIAVKRAGALLAFLESKGVSVIRCGLHASEDLASGKNFLDGPFHPAFGAKARSYIFGMLLKKLLTFKTSETERVVFNSFEEPYLRGFSKSNFLKLQKLLGKGSLDPRASFPKMHIKAVFENSTVTVDPGDLDIHSHGDI